MQSFCASGNPFEKKEGGEESITDTGVSSTEKTTQDTQDSEASKIQEAQETKETEFEFVDTKEGEPLVSSPVSSPAPVDPSLDAGPGSPSPLVEASTSVEGSAEEASAPSSEISQDTTQTLQEGESTSNDVSGSQQVIHTGLGCSVESCN